MRTTSPPIAPPKSSGRLLLWLGPLAVVAGIALYVIQVAAEKLTTPWYVPALASLGTAFVLLSLLKRPTVWRVIAVVLVGLVTAGEWLALLSARQPAGTGRIAKDHELPEFTAYEADGKAFTRDRLKGDQDTVLVFFRGHWWLVCNIELGQLEARHEDFAKRNTRVVAVSLDNLKDSGKTREKFPHLVIVSDEKESLARAAELIAPQPQHAKDGGDTLSPTTVLIDRGGVVRWVSRKDTFLARPTPDEVLAAIDQQRRGG